jgi:hypothetical protein
LQFAYCSTMSFASCSSSNKPTLRICSDRLANPAIRELDRPVCELKPGSRTGPFVRKLNLLSDIPFQFTNRYTSSLIFLLYTLYLFDQHKILQFNLALTWYCLTKYLSFFPYQHLGVSWGTGAL